LMLVETLFAHDWTPTLGVFYPPSDKRREKCRIKVLFIAP
jgi:hypothetical protein